MNYVNKRNKKKYALIKRFITLFVIVSSLCINLNAEDNSVSNVKNQIYEMLDLLSLPCDVKQKIFKVLSQTQVITPDSIVSLNLTDTICSRNIGRISIDCFSFEEQANVVNVKMTRLPSGEFIDSNLVKLDFHKVQDDSTTYYKIQNTLSFYDFVVNLISVLN